jgi:hypothetical protein
VPIANENRLVLPDTLGTMIKLTRSASSGARSLAANRLQPARQVPSPIYGPAVVTCVEIRCPRASGLTDRLSLQPAQGEPRAGGRLRNVSTAGVFQSSQARLTMPSMRCLWIASSPRPGGTERPVLAQSLLSRCSVQGDRSVRHRCSWQLPVPRLVLQRWVSWICPPGCDCGFRPGQERDYYAAHPSR